MNTNVYIDNIHILPPSDKGVNRDMSKSIIPYSSGNDSAGSWVTTPFSSAQG